MKIFRLHSLSALYLFVSAVIPIPASAVGLPSHFPVPGGIAVLDLPEEVDQSIFGQPVAKFGSRSLMVISDSNRWRVLVGLPCRTLPGNYIVNFETPEAETGTVDLQVLPIAHGCTDKPHRLSGKLANAAVLNNVFHSTELTNTLSADTEVDPAIPYFDFTEITEARLTIPYGMLIQNRKLQRHDYVSYLSKPNAPVYTPARATVVAILEDDRPYRTVLLSHGSGVYSVISHIKNLQIQTGQIIQSGEILGSSYAMQGLGLGKVDWGLIMNGNLINPLQFSNPS